MADHVEFDGGRGTTPAFVPHAFEPATSLLPLLGAPAPSQH
jgi:hypothetical protein